MLPHELKLVRRIASDTERRACFRYMGTTGVPTDAPAGLYFAEMVWEHRERWVSAPEWMECIDMCAAEHLPMDGRMVGE